VEVTVEVTVELGLRVEVAVEEDIVMRRRRGRSMTG